MWITISILNIILAYYAEQNYDSNKKKCKFFLASIIIANIIIFGLRDIGVGTDTMLYIDQYFIYAYNVSGVYDLFLADANYDKGFLVLACLAHIIGNTSNSLLFLTEFLIIFFIVVGMYKLKQSLKYSMTWFMVFFCILLQHETINLMRQFCAMALLFFGYSFFLQKKYVIFLLCQIIAFYFHSSSVLFVTIPLAQLLSETNSKIKYIYIFVSIIVGFCFLFFYFNFLTHIENLGLLKEVYFDTYGKGSHYESSNIKVGLSTLIPYILLCILIFFLYYNHYLSEQILYIFIFLFIMSFIFTMSSVFVMRYFFRIAYYMELIMIVYLSAIVIHNKQIIKALSLAYTISILFIIIRTFIWNYYGTETFKRNDNSLIYKSQILGIDESK